MADAARPRDVVKPPPRNGTPRPATFAHHIQQVVDECGDVASEDAWQAFSRVIVAHWEELSASQAPAATWTMMARATETIVKLRRGQQQSQTQSGADALAEFRAFMDEVTGRDSQA